MFTASIRLFAAAAVAVLTWAPPERTPRCRVPTFR